MLDLLALGLQACVEGIATLDGGDVDAVPV